MASLAPGKQPVVACADVLLSLFFVAIIEAQWDSLVQLLISA